VNLAGFVNASQSWRIVQGAIPSCPVGTVVTLTTTGYRLDVSRPWFGVVAQLDLRTATINATDDGRELTLGTPAGEVVFENEAFRAVGLGGPPASSSAAYQPSHPALDVAALDRQIVQFGATVPNALGWNVFVFLVLERVNGWLLGLTQAGHPAGIAESNIAWARVVDPGPRTPPDRLVLSYVGPRRACDRAFQAEAPTLHELGYEPVHQHFRQEPRSTATVIVAILLGLILAIVLIGIAILAWLILTRPPGVLTVTFQRVRAG